MTNIWEMHKQVLQHHGEETQIDKCIEEMAELTQALLKYKYNKENNNYVKNVIEELCDLQNVIEQIKEIINLTETEKEFNMYMKMQREVERIHSQISSKE